MNLIRNALILGSVLIASSIVWGQEPLTVEQMASERLRDFYGSANPITRVRAYKVHDRILIRINERISGKSEATTDTSRQSSIDIKMEEWKGAGTITNKPEIKLTSKGSLSGDGEVERKGQFTAELAGEVLDVLPNGHLRVSAKSGVHINGEKQMLTFTGIVDPRDLDAESGIDAQLVMDKQIRYDGVGDISKVQKRPWGKRILDTISPF